MNSIRLHSVLAIIFLGLISSCNPNWSRLNNPSAHFKPKKSKLYVKKIESHHQLKYAGSGNPEYINDEDFINTTENTEFVKSSDENEYNQLQGKKAKSSKRLIRKDIKSKVKILKEAIRQNRNRDNPGVEGNEYKFDALGLVSFFLSLMGILLIFNLTSAALIFLGIFVQIPALMFGVMAIYRHKMFDTAGHGFGTAGIILSSFILLVLGLFIGYALLNEFEEDF